MSRPIWKPELAPLMVRFAIGCYFVAAAFAKFNDMVGFMENVKNIKVLPAHFAMPFGVLLPYIELVMGVFLIIGLWTTLSSIVIACILAFYIYIFHIFVAGSWIINKEVILLLATLSLLSSGAGAASVDRFRQDG